MEAAERVKIMSSTDGDETFSPLSPRASTHKVRPQCTAPHWTAYCWRVNL